MSGTTLREIHEGCRRRHSPGADDRYCDICRVKCPCADYSDAVAALAILDAAEVDYPELMSTGMGQVERIDEVYEPDGVAIYVAAHRRRLIPDPGCASREPDGET